MPVALEFVAMLLLVGLFVRVGNLIGSTLDDALDASDRPTRDDSR